MPAEGIPCCIHLERRRRHAPSRKAALKKTTASRAGPKVPLIGEETPKKSGPSHWLRCPSWVIRVDLAAFSARRVWLPLLNTERDRDLHLRATSGLLASRQSEYHFLTEPLRVEAQPSG